MAPEILRESPPTEQSDIFSLGVVLYEMAGGKAPFKGKTLADSVHLTLAVEPAELDVKALGLPEDLNRILKKALNKEPPLRYATVRDLAVDLKAVQRQSLVGVHFMPRVSNTRRRRVQIVTVVVIFAVAALGLTTVLLLMRSHKARNETGGAAPAAAAQTRLLAVLPFHVIGGDANSSAYSEGLREAITTSLASVAPSAHIEVLAASEVRAHALTTPEEAHKELGVDLVIDGSYQQFRNEVRITYEMSNASGAILSSGNLSATLTDPFSLQNHVVTGVLQMLSVSAAGVEQTPQQFGTQNPAAYDAYLRGVGYLRDFQIGENVKKAIESFTEATRDDPRFAAAHAGLGEAQWAEYKAETNMALIAAARASCQQAMRLGDNVAEAHICQATIDDGTGEAPQAQAEFQRALQLDPQSDTALNGLAQTWEEMDNPDQAQHVYQQAIQARPFYWANYYAQANFLVRRADYARAADVLEQAVQKVPENSFLARRLGVVYFLEGRLDDAARTLEQAIAERPDAMAWMDLGQVYLHQRKYSLAITNLELAAKARPNLNSIQADLGDAYAWSGAPKEQADARYREALALSRSSLAVNARDLDALMVAAYSAAALGQEQDAMRYLNAALEHAPQDAEVNYYAARVYARLGDAATAREWVQKAVAHGYSQADIETAPDLAAVAK
jgi:tetratricopeptide (TPR) repeat protein